MLASERERDDALRGEILGDALERAEAGLDVGRLDRDLLERRDADLERLAVELLVVELDLPGGFQDGLRAESRAREVGGGLIERRGNDRDSRRREARLLRRQTEEQGGRRRA